jgi:hypothetical protein
MARSRSLWLASLTIALVYLPSARAAGVDKLVPSDSEVVVTFNVRQILDSPFVKKKGLPAAREALKSADDANQVLEELGFDPFTDIDRVTVVGPGGKDQERGLIIVRGRFDLDKFKARADKAARDDGDVLKIGKGAGKVVYEVSVPGQDVPLFVCLLNKTTLLASPGKDYVVEAIKKDSGKEEAGVKDKGFQALLDKVDDQQSVSLAANGTAFKGGDLGQLAEIFEKIDALAGGATIGDELKLEVVLSARTEDDAKNIKEAVNSAINTGIALLGTAAGDNKNLDKFLDVLKTVKATAKNKTVTLKLRVSAEVLDGLSGKDDN